MIHKRIIRSALHFHPVTNLHPSLDASALVLGAVQRCLQAEAVELACLWDAAALLVKTHKEEAAADADEEAAEQDGTEDAGTSQADGQVDEAERERHSAVCRSSDLQVPCGWHAPRCGVIPLLSAMQLQILSGC